MPDSLSRYAPIHRWKNTRLLPMTFLVQASSQSDCRMSASCRAIFTQLIHAVASGKRDEKQFPPQMIDGADNAIRCAGSNGSRSHSAEPLSIPFLYFEWLASYAMP